MSEHPIARDIEVANNGMYTQAKHCNRWAVIVGISDYKDKRLNLSYADRDAESLYQLLLTPQGGQFQPEHVCKLTNREATTSSITRALRSFLKKPAREDLVIIYFACHGSPDPDRPGNVYLLTYDTDPMDIAGTALPMEDINRSLTNTLLSEKVVILADTCHSAAISSNLRRRSAIESTTLVNRYLKEISTVRGGTALLTSAEANEVSFEAQKWGGGHGVFTYYLLKGLEGEADVNNNGFVTVGELFEYVRANVKQATNHRQHPSIGTNPFDRNLPLAITDSKTTNKTPESTGAKKTDTDAALFEKATSLLNSPGAKSQSKAGYLPFVIGAVMVGSIGLWLTTDTQVPQPYVKPQQREELTASERRNRACSYYAGNAKLGQRLTVSLCSIVPTDVQTDSSRSNFTYYLGNEEVVSQADCTQKTWTTFPEEKVHQPGSAATKNMLNVVCNYNDTAEPATVFAPPSNIRTSPNGRTLCTIEREDTINVYGAVDTWYFTDACGSLGVVHVSQIKL